MTRTSIDWRGSCAYIRFYDSSRQPESVLFEALRTTLAPAGRAFRYGAMPTVERTRRSMEICFGRPLLEPTHCAPRRPAPIPQTTHEARGQERAQSRPARRQRGSQAPPTIPHATPQPLHSLLSAAPTPPRCSPECQCHEGRGRGPLRTTGRPMGQTTDRSRSEQGPGGDSDS